MSLLNKTKTREYALHLASLLRTEAKFTNVSKAFLEDVEVALRTVIRQKVHTNPSLGVTLK